MDVCFLAPILNANKFSGGIYCVMKYAQGLLEMGHNVYIVAPPGSQYPEWANFDGEVIIAGKPALDFSSLRKFRHSLSRRNTFSNLRKQSKSVKREIIRDAMVSAIPPCDFVVATFWDTAFTACLSPYGKPLYFMQHFEPLFSKRESVNYSYAMATYSLPIIPIANSSWLKSKVEQYLKVIEHDANVELCINAVDLDVYLNERVEEASGPNKKEVNIVSFGGRGVIWKAFEDMAEAMAIVRCRLPEYKINWNVFGSATLPADNSVATYNDLGFLQPSELAKAYRSNDILLSASWYESFPLFPIEAMASGIAVVTTKKGTEDYAQHENNCLLVQERDPNSIADGVVRLIEDRELRHKLAKAGNATARQFNWERSILNLENILKRYLPS